MKDEFEIIVAKARKTSRAFDAIDRKNGNATPSECGQHEIVKTAMAAMRCAISMKDWNCVAEAYVMLEDLVK